VQLAHSVRAANARFSKENATVKYYVKFRKDKELLKQFLRTLTLSLRLPHDKLPPAP